MRKPTKPIQIRKIARIRDKATGDYFEIVEFPVSATERSRLELPPSVVVDTGAFEKRLRDAGAILPKHKTREFLRSVAGRKAPLNLIYESQTGWTEDRKLFVLHDGVIGRSKERILGINQAQAAGDASGHLTVAGNWKRWRSTVGKAAGLSSILMCGVCTAFAAPLLSLVGYQSFMICIVGPSRSGKSITALTAGSVIGIGKVSDLVTWNITDARLEQRLSGFNDCVFPIDDLMALRDQRDRDRYLRIQAIAYKLAQGWATARHDSFTQARGGNHAGWRTIALTSNEVSIRDLARKVHLERQRGEAIRLIDLPALDGESDHVFDQLPRKLSPAKMVDWKRKKFSEIAEACENNHGVAYRRYITCLIAMRSRLAPYVQHRVDYFIRHVRDNQDSDLSRDIAKRFALLYAGGMLARRSRLVAWESNEILAAIKKCYFKARCLLPDDAELLRAGIGILAKKLTSLPVTSLRNKGEFSKDRCDVLDGYRQPGPRRAPHLIKRHAFDNLFVSRHQQELVEAWLLNNGRLAKALPKGNGSNISVPKEQHIWLDGERRRSLEIRWSRSDMLHGPKWAQV
jgi:putative DNA primase/helicase